MLKCYEIEVLANCPARDEFYFALWILHVEISCSFCWLCQTILYSDHSFRPGNGPCLTLDRSFEEVSFLRIVRCRTGSILHFDELHAKIGWSSVGYVRLLYTLSNYFTLMYQGRLYGGTAHGEVAISFVSMVLQWQLHRWCMGRCKLSGEGQVLFCTLVDCMWRSVDLQLMMSDF